MSCRGIPRKSETSCQFERNAQPAELSAVTWSLVDGSVLAGGVPSALGAAVFCSRPIYADPSTYVAYVPVMYFPVNPAGNPPGIESGGTTCAVSEQPLVVAMGIFTDTPVGSPSVKKTMKFKAAVWFRRTRSS